MTEHEEKLQEEVSQVTYCKTQFTWEETSDGQKRLVANLVPSYKFTGVRVDVDTVLEVAYEEQSTASEVEPEMGTWKLYVFSSTENTNQFTEEAVFCAVNQLIQTWPAVPNI